MQYRSSINCFPSIFQRVVLKFFMTIFYILEDNYFYESRFLSNFSFAFSIFRSTLQNYLFTTLKSKYFFLSLLLYIQALYLKFEAWNFTVASYLAPFLFN